MVVDPLRHRVYKRLETDGEFRARIVEEYKKVRKLSYGLSELWDDELDEHAWEHFKIQRKIVEVTSGAS